MLKEFQVENFKNFKDPLKFSLKAGNYTFNDNVIKNGIVNNSIIYGENGTGKSNLVRAMMDITTHLTDYNMHDREYRNYLNLFSVKEYASFKYCFIFGESELVYEYDKSSYSDILNEKILIDSEIVIESSNNAADRKVNLKGAENLNLNFDVATISFVKYVLKNTILIETDKNVQVLKEFEKFINGMLSFNSLEGNYFQGLQSESGKISESIISHNKLPEFQEFLKDIGINYNLVSKTKDDEKQIYVVFPNEKEVNFYSIASRGTKAATLFFHWFIQFDKVSFVIMDEFDSYYHNVLTRKIVEKVIESKVQSIFSTHNTSVMSNDILRPDSYFIIENNDIVPISDTTNKELRKAHNIEKMYRAGAFKHET